MRMTGIKIHFRAGQWLWQCRLRQSTPLVPPVEWQRQADLCKLQASLVGLLIKFQGSQSTQRNSVLKKTIKTNRPTNQANSTVQDSKNPSRSFMISTALLQTVVTSHSKCSLMMNRPVTGSHSRRNQTDKEESSHLQATSQWGGSHR